jgi:hypothetical protein
MAWHQDFLQSNFFLKELPIRHLGSVNLCCLKRAGIGVNNAFTAFDGELTPYTVLELLSLVEGDIFMKDYGNGLNSKL